MALSGVEEIFVMKNIFGSSIKARLALTSAALLTLVPGAVTVQAQSRHDNLLRAALSPFNQVPAVLTGSSGTFDAQINSDGTITFSLTYSNMTSAVTQAHIHFGASRTNGGVMVFLCGGSKPACPASGTITGTLTATDVSTLPSTNTDSVIPQGIQAADLNALLEAIRSGNSYVNVHTANFPSGEIRGQVAVF
jgi:hypothetical protein